VTGEPEKETEMTLDSPSRRIVVGYDGAPGSRVIPERVVDRTETRATAGAAS